MIEWFVMREGKAEGPYSDFQLHRFAVDGAIAPTDLVWYTGRQEFIPACEVPNLFATGSPSRPLPVWLADYIESADPIRSGDSQIISPRKTSYLRRHWCGDLSLELTFWVNGAILFFTLYTVPVVSPGIFTSRTNPIRTWIYLLVFLAALTIVSVWQLVGIWRSAGKHQSRGGRSLWGWSARAMVVLFVLNNGERVVRYTPFILDGSMAVFGYDPLGTYQIRLLQEGTELEVSGYLTFGVTEDVRKTLDSAQVKIIRLNSLGGRMGEGHELHKLIRAHSLITYTANECSSACTIAFLGGQKRFIAAQARLGFHQPGAPGLSQVDLQGARADGIKSLVEAGVSPSFADRAFSVPNTEVWYPTPQELLEAGVVTGHSSRSHSETHEAAERGVPEAQFDLGWMYAQGRGVTRNDTEAVKWYRKAADQGFSHAQYGLAVMYDEGRGVKQNYAEALKWYRKAGDQGDVMAQYDVGLRYQQGDGVARDDTEAVDWYRKAANQGYDRAQHKLGLMYANGQGVMADYTEAYAWLSLAAAQGNNEAKATLDIARKSMTSRQIAKAQATAAAWKAASAQRHSREDTNGQ
jgi:hypothetical protein